MKGAQTRANAATILAALQAHSGSLASHLDELPAGDDGGLLQELCFGSCRHFHELDFLAGTLLSKPLRPRDQDIRCLLVIGIYQLRFLRIPDHAAVNETVEATTLMGKPWARALVNGVLRSYQKSLPMLDQKLTKASAEVRSSHPYWLLKRLRHDWGTLASSVMDANNRRAPMTLRVNARKVTATRYLDQLEAAGIAARPGSLAPTAVYLEKPCAVTLLPGFADGLVSVQDEASQLTAGLLNLAPGQRVLDACAAPGGKTCLILESEPGLGSMQALDISAARQQTLEQNLQRLGLDAMVGVGDASRPDTWWDGIPFDRILLDAPCSATGVIRRHPDIKLLRRDEDLADLQAQQRLMLSRLWPCLKPGGHLLYATCSVLRCENEDIICAFLESQPDVKCTAMAADWGVECRFGRQLLPDPEGTDGFYFCLLTKH